MGHGLIAWIIIGLLAGWITGKLMKGSGFGFFMDMIVGLVGAISGLASLDAAQAATVAGPNATEVLGARSYAELLDPIPNALAMLREVEAADPAPAHMRWWAWRRDRSQPSRLAVVAPHSRSVLSGFCSCRPALRICTQSGGRK